MRLRALVIAAVFVVVLPTGVGRAAPAECRSDNLKVVLRLNQSRYTTDEPVRMKMIVKNMGPRCTMVWSDGQSHTFYVFEDDKKIWDKSACRFFTQAIVREEWASGHREVYRARWRGSKNGTANGECKRHIANAGPGRYEAQGHFMGDGEPRTERIAFRVTR